MVMQDALWHHSGTAAKLTILKFFFKNFRNVAYIIKKWLRRCKQDRNWVRFAIATFLPLLTWYNDKLKFMTKDCLPNVVLWGEGYALASKKAWFLTRMRHAEEGYSVLPYMKFLLFSCKCSLAMLAAMAVYGYCLVMDVSPSQFDITIMDTPIVPYLFTFVTMLFFSSVRFFCLMFFFVHFLPYVFSLCFVFFHFLPYVFLLTF